MHFAVGLKYNQAAVNRLSCKSLTLGQRGAAARKLYSDDLVWICMPLKGGCLLAPSQIEMSSSIIILEKKINIKRNKNV